MNFITEHIGTVGAGIVIVLLSFIQIAPIKINPWSAIIKWIGSKLNGEVIEKVDAIATSVNENKKDSDEKWASLKRSHILNFGDDILHKNKHSKEHFDQILLDISDYERYCSEHPDYMNNVASATITLIKNTYQNNLVNNDFL